MMAKKALLFNDISMYNKIMKTKQPFLIKKYGRLVKNFDPETWNKNKFDIIISGNLLKFSDPVLLKIYVVLEIKR